MRQRKTGQSRVLRRLAALIAVSLLVAACGADDDPGAEADPTEPTGEQTGEQAEEDPPTLRVAYVPAVTYTYLWRAEEAGYFEDAGLDVELVSSVGGLATVPAIEAGEIEFGGVDVMGAISAVEQGVPIRYINIPAFIESDSPMEALMTDRDDIQGAEDLVGEQVAVNLSYNIEWVMLRRWLEQEGVDPDEVDIVEVPFPDMLEAVRSGTIAAAGFAEPFVTIAEAQGLRNIGYFWADVVDSIAASGIVGDVEFMETYPETTRRFAEALERGIADVAGDEALSRELLQEYAGMDPELADVVKLPRFNTELDLSSVEQWTEWARQENLTEGSLEGEDLIWEGVRN